MILRIEAMMTSLNCWGDSETVDAIFKMMVEYLSVYLYNNDVKCGVYISFDKIHILV